MELRLWPEVEDQRNLEIRRPEVVECLAFRRRMKCVSRLDFDHNPLVHDHVDSLRRERVTLVEDGNGNFPTDKSTSFHQLAFERQRIHVLEKAEPKGEVNVKERADDVARGTLLDESVAHAEQLLPRVTAPSHAFQRHSPQFSKFRAGPRVTSSRGQEAPQQSPVTTVTSVFQSLTKPS